MTAMPAPLHAPETAAAARGRLRRFGVTVGIAFLILAAFLFWRERPAWPIIAGVGGALALLGLIWPAILAPIEKVWMTAARALGWVMTRVILGVVFAVIFTPVGLVLRLVRKDYLELRFPGDGADGSAGNDRSYWHRRDDQDRSPARMEKMF